MLALLRRRLLLFLAAILLAPAANAAERGPLVLAAASLQESLGAAADAWAAKGHVRPILSFAGSSALARQIIAGAPADLFLSADEPWMDAVEKAGMTKAGTRTTLLGNRLVLIGPASGTLRLAPARGFPLAHALGGGRLAVANTDAVPAGKYAKAALTALGVWNGVAGKLAPAENVRAAMALVERGAAPLGIVYATDAAGHAGVRVVGRIPPQSHEPIVYDAAMIADRDAPAVAAFFDYLRSDAAGAVFEAAGFTFRPLD